MDEFKKIRKTLSENQRRTREEQEKWRMAVEEEKAVKEKHRQSREEYQEEDLGHLEARIRIGKEILAILNPLHRDSELINTITGEYSDRNRVIHQRILTDTNEYQDEMPLGRTVIEKFLINRNNELVYMQEWVPRQWAEAIARRWETSGHRIKLGKPGDFSSLSTVSVQSLHESVKHGKHIDTLAESLRNQR